MHSKHVVHFHHSLLKRMLLALVSVHLKVVIYLEHLHSQMKVNVQLVIQLLKDLDYLEKQGLVRRSHGGAVPADHRIDAPISFRKGTRAQEKARICRLAATLISPNSLIFTDASTTVLHLSDYLKESDNPTVVTNGYPLCRALVERNLRVFSTGGRLLKHSMAFAGQVAEDTVSRFNADLFFFSTSSLSEDGQISDYSEEVVALRVAMLRRSEKSVLLCNSEKIGTRSAFCLASLSEVDYLVTDAMLPSTTVGSCRIFLLREQDGAFLYGIEKTAE